MCKYCKRLEELRKQEKKDNERTIDNWRSYAYKCDLVMQVASKMLQKLITNYDVCREDCCDAELIIDNIIRLVDVDYVGK